MPRRSIAPAAAGNGGARCVRAAVWAMTRRTPRMAPMTGSLLSALVVIPLIAGLACGTTTDRTVHSADVDSGRAVPASRPDRVAPPAPVAAATPSAADRADSAVTARVG